MSEHPSTENDKPSGDPIAENVTDAADAGVAETADAADEVVAQVPSPDAVVDAPVLEPAAAPIVTPAAAPVAPAAPVEEPAVRESVETVEVVDDDATRVIEPIVVVKDDVVKDDVAPVGEPGDPIEESHTDADRAAAAAAVAAMADDDDTPWYDRVEVTEATSVLPESVREHAAPASDLADAATVASETVVAEVPVAPPAAPQVSPEAAAAAATAAGASFPVPQSQQPIFVQAPEPPRKRGNRGFAGVVGLIATLIFAVLYLAATLFAADPSSYTDGAKLGQDAVAQLSTFSFWTPVVAFFLGFWLLGAFINTAKWGYWVVFGLLVGVIALAGHVGGALLQANPLQTTPSEALTIVKGSLFTLPALVAFVIGRELPVWFGGWIARHGRGVVAANAEAQAEYQATLDAGPQLVQQ